MPTTYEEFVILILDIIQLMIAALFALVFMYFMWKMIDSWILNAGEESKREEGKKYAVAAVIAFVVIVSAWGIVTMIKNTVFG
jgi:ABC-type multidrug transport system fused ATPase/permease subunit